jgi:acyl-CoA thioesterase YciA
MAPMDLAGGIASAARSIGRVVTGVVDGTHLIRPVDGEGVLCVRTSVDHAGRTSKTIAIEARIRRFRMGVLEQATRAIFAVVAVDAAGMACIETSAFQAAML